MFRVITAGCVLALGLSTPFVAAQKATRQSRRQEHEPRQHCGTKVPPANRSLKGVSDVIFLGDSITQGWEGQKPGKNTSAPFRSVNLGIGGDQTGHVLWPDH